MRIWVSILVIFLLGCSPKNSSKINLGKLDLLQNKQVQLASPQIQIDSVLFLESALVQLSFDLEDAAIYYQLDDDPPLKYVSPFEVKETRLLQVHAQKEGFLKSDIVNKQLIKASTKLKDAIITINPTPHKNYPGEGLVSLTDLKKGSTNFKEGNLWAGFIEWKVEIDIEFPQPTIVNKVTLSLLEDNGSWIFLPKEIYFEDGFPATYLPFPKEDSVPNLKFIPLEIETGVYKKVNISIINHDKIPDWHPGEGTPPWLFIDEIIVE